MPLTESSCTDAYAYAYDESSKTALWTCDANLHTDYTVTYVPRSALLSTR
jgi:hypothetical protein